MDDLHGNKYTSLLLSLIINFVANYYSAVGSQRPAYPSSKAKLRDWDKLEAEVKKEVSVQPSTFILNCVCYTLDDPKLKLSTCVTFMRWPHDCLTNFRKKKRS